MGGVGASGTVGGGRAALANGIASAPETARGNGSKTTSSRDARGAGARAIARSRETHRGPHRRRIGRRAGDPTPAARACGRGRTNGEDEEARDEAGAGVSGRAGVVQRIEANKRLGRAEGARLVRDEMEIFLRSADRSALAHARQRSVGPGPVGLTRANSLRKIITKSGANLANLETPWRAPAGQEKRNNRTPPAAFVRLPSTPFGRARLRRCPRRRLRSRGPPSRASRAGLPPGSAPRVARARRRASPRAGSAVAASSSRACSAARWRRRRLPGGTTRFARKRARRTATPSRARWRAAWRTTRPRFAR